MKTTKLAKVAAPLFETLRAQDAERRSIRLADQAKLIRAAVADAFPATKFSVRSKSYSGGCSITISWVDGPTTKEIDAIAGRYEGGGFDGSIDLAYYKQHWFAPDGSVTFAHTSGTAGSRGCVAERCEDAHNPSALLVSFDAHYVHTARSYSPAAKQAALEKLASNYGPVMDLPALPRYEIRQGIYGTIAELTSDPHLGHEYLSTLVYRVLEGHLSFGGAA